MAKPKTAVVLIHGIGEQRPMDTLWGFVRAAWTHDAELVHATRNEVWSKPELVTGSFELRRITTREASYGDKRRFDFFEFYWAHRMQGHTLGGLLRWTLKLFLRAPSQVPKGLFLAWGFGVGLLVAAAVLAILAWQGDLMASLGIPRWIVISAPLILAAGSFILHAVILPQAGDAARYLSPEPNNVAIRQQIREDGVSLIEKLTASGEYDRIVVAGHSLGSVIAHDLLNFAWNRLDRSKISAIHAADSAAMEVLSALEAAARDLVDASPADRPARRTAYRNAQRLYHKTLAKGEAPLWIVSDLVTIGSPLSKAALLIGHDAEDLQARIARREIPSSPPVLEGKKGNRRFSYPPANKVRRPHHGAVFGPTVWTNLYHPHHLIWFGDIVSGPLRQLFGPAVLDVRLPIGKPPGFRHLDYWKNPDAEPVHPTIAALRRALNLRARDTDEALWGEAAGKDEIVADTEMQGD